jgi:hypothetical protein
LESTSDKLQIDFGKFVSKLREHSFFRQAAEDNKQISIRFEVVLDFIDNWTETSLLKIEQNGQYFFESSFVNCPNNFSQEQCLKNVGNLCRNADPDVIGNSFTFDFDYLETATVFTLSLRRDPQMQSQVNTGEQSEQFDFALGVHSLFVYFKFNGQ